MKSKQIKIAGIVIIASYLLVICLYCFHQKTKSHTDARQAESFVYQLTDYNYNIRNDILISKRTAIKIADRLFSEKYGLLNALLRKPFDVFLINGYWFVYGPGSRSKPDYGPMITINQYTGETRFKP